MITCCRISPLLSGENTNWSNNDQQYFDSEREREIAQVYTAPVKLVTPIKLPEPARPAIKRRSSIKTYGTSPCPKTPKAPKTTPNTLYFYKDTIPKKESKPLIAGINDMLSFDLFSGLTSTERSGCASPSRVAPTTTSESASSVTSSEVVEDILNNLLGEKNDSVSAASSEVIAEILVDVTTKSDNFLARSSMSTDVPEVASDTVSARRRRRDRLALSGTKTRHSDSSRSLPVTVGAKGNRLEDFEKPREKTDHAEGTLDDLRERSCSVHKCSKHSTECSECFVTKIINELRAMLTAAAQHTDDAVQTLPSQTASELSLACEQKLSETLVSMAANHGDTALAQTPDTIEKKTKDLAAVVADIKEAAKTAVDVLTEFIERSVRESSAARPETDEVKVKTVSSRILSEVVGKASAEGVMRAAFCGEKSAQAQRDYSVYMVPSQSTEALCPGTRHLDENESVAHAMAEEELGNNTENAVQDMFPDLSDDSRLESPGSDDNTVSDAARRLRPRRPQHGSMNDFRRRKLKTRRLREQVVAETATPRFNETDSVSVAEKSKPEQCAPVLSEDVVCEGVITEGQATSQEDDVVDVCDVILEAKDENLRNLTVTDNFETLIQVAKDVFSSHHVHHPKQAAAKSHSDDQLTDEALLQEIVRRFADRSAAGEGEQLQSDPGLSQAPKPELTPAEAALSDTSVEQLKPSVFPRETGDVNASAQSEPRRCLEQELLTPLEEVYGDKTVRFDVRVAGVRVVKAPELHRLAAGDATIIQTFTAEEFFEMEEEALPAAKCELFRPRKAIMSTLLPAPFVRPAAVVMRVVHSRAAETVMKKGHVTAWNPRKLTIIRPKARYRITRVEVVKPSVFVSEVARVYPRPQTRRARTVVRRPHSVTRATQVEEQPRTRRTGSTPKKKTELSRKDMVDLINQGKKCDGAECKENKLMTEVLRVEGGDQRVSPGFVSSDIYFWKRDTLKRESGGKEGGDDVEHLTEQFVGSVLKKVHRALSRSRSSQDVLERLREIEGMFHDVIGDLKDPDASLQEEASSRNLQGDVRWGAQQVEVCGGSLHEEVGRICTTIRSAIQSQMSLQCDGDQKELQTPCESPASVDQVRFVTAALAGISLALICRDSSVREKTNKPSSNPNNIDIAVVMYDILLGATGSIRDAETKQAAAGILETTETLIEDLSSLSTTDASSLGHQDLSLRTTETENKREVCGTCGKCSSQDRDERAREPGERVRESEQRVQEPKKVVRQPKERVQEPGKSVREPEQRTREPEQRMQEPGERAQEAGKRAKKPGEKVREPRERVREPEQRMQEPKERAQKPRERVWESKERTKEPRVSQSVGYFFGLVNKSPDTTACKEPSSDNGTGDNIVTVLSDVLENVYRETTAKSGVGPGPWERKPGELCTAGEHGDELRRELLENAAERVVARAHHLVCSSATELCACAVEDDGGSVPVNRTNFNSNGLHKLHCSHQDRARSAMDRPPSRPDVSQDRALSAVVDSLSQVVDNFVRRSLADLKLNSESSESCSRRSTPDLRRTASDSPWVSSTDGAIAVEIQRFSSQVLSLAHEKHQILMKKLLLSKLVEDMLHNQIDNLLHKSCEELTLESMVPGDSLVPETRAPCVHEESDRLSQVIKCLVDDTTKKIAEIEQNNIGEAATKIVSSVLESVAPPADNENCWSRLPEIRHNLRQAVDRKQMIYRNHHQDTWSRDFARSVSDVTRPRNEDERTKLDRKVSELFETTLFHAKRKHQDGFQKICGKTAQKVITNVAKHAGRDASVQTLGTVARNMVSVATQQTVDNMFPPAGYHDDGNLLKLPRVVSRGNNQQKQQQHYHHHQQQKQLQQNQQPKRQQRQRCFQCQTGDDLPGTAESTSTKNAVSVKSVSTSKVDEGCQVRNMPAITQRKSSEAGSNVNQSCGKSDTSVSTSPSKGRPNAASSPGGVGDGRERSTRGQRPEGSTGAPEVRVKREASAETPTTRVSDTCQTEKASVRLSHKSLHENENKKRKFFANFNKQKVITPLDMTGVALGSKDVWRSVPAHESDTRILREKETAAAAAAAHVGEVKGILKHDNSDSNTNHKTVSFNGTNDSPMGTTTVSSGGTPSSERRASMLPFNNAISPVSEDVAAEDKTTPPPGGRRSTLQTLHQAVRRHIKALQGQIRATPSDVTPPHKSVRAEKRRPVTPKLEREMQQMRPAVPPRWDVHSAGVLPHMREESASVYRPWKQTTRLQVQAEEARPPTRAYEDGSFPARVHPDEPRHPEPAHGSRYPTRVHVGGSRDPARAHEPTHVQTKNASVDAAVDPGAAVVTSPRTELEYLLSRSRSRQRRASPQINNEGSSGPASVRSYPRRRTPRATTLIERETGSDGLSALNAHLRNYRSSRCTMLQKILVS